MKCSFCPTIAIPYGSNLPNITLRQRPIAVFAGRLGACELHVASLWHAQAQETANAIGGAPWMH